MVWKHGGEDAAVSPACGGSTATGVEESVCHLCRAEHRESIVGSDRFVDRINRGSLLSRKANQREQASPVPLQQSFGLGSRKATFYFFLGLPRGGRLDSMPSVLAVACCHESEPNGVPRKTLLRIDFSSLCDSMPLT